MDPPGLELARRFVLTFGKKAERRLERRLFALFPVLK